MNKILLKQTMNMNSQIEVLDFGNASVTKVAQNDGPPEGQIVRIVRVESKETRQEDRKRPPSELSLMQVLKGDEEAATEIDNTVVLHMKRPAYVYNVVSGAVIGEIHAQYSPPERSQYQEFFDHHNRPVTQSGDDATTTPPQRALPNRQTETIDSGIRFISSEVGDAKSLRPRGRRFIDSDDDEDDMPVFSWKSCLCWGSCLSKKVKPAEKKGGLLARIRNCFRRY